jgi:hypothetical protein
VEIMNFYAQRCWIHQELCESGEAIAGNSVALMTKQPNIS